MEKLLLLIEQNRMSEALAYAKDHQQFEQLAQQIEAEPKLLLVLALDETINHHHDLAFKYLKQAAELDLVQAYYPLALAYFQKQDETSGLIWLKKAYLVGDGEATLEYLKLGIKGVVDISQETIDDCIQQMLNQQYIPIYNFLGEYAISYKKNHDEALAYFIKGSENGDANASFNLGQCYFFGYFGGVNYEQAQSYFYLARKDGREDALSFEVECLEKLGHAQKAHDFLVKQDQLGNIMATILLGKRYLSSPLYSPSMRKAYGYLKRVQDYPEVNKMYKKAKTAYYAQLIFFFASLFLLLFVLIRVIL